MGGFELVVNPVKQKVYLTFDVADAEQLDCIVNAVDIELRFVAVEGRAVRVVLATMELPRLI